MSAYKAVRIAWKKEEETDGYDNMKEIVIGSNEAGQRLDKLMAKVLNQATASFIYKMLRKKNIKLNQKRAEGKEILRSGDQVQIYLSDETFDKFHKDKAVMEGFPKDPVSKKNPFLKELNPHAILYQDDHIMVLNKPAGVLSQKAKPEDDSMNEQMLRYLLGQGTISRKQLETFTPSVCNRLDRNTSGILLAGVSLMGSQELSRMLKERSLDKYYLALISGTMTESMEATAYLQKDSAANRVSITRQPGAGSMQIETHYNPLLWNEKYTLVEVKLITGKPHQIRAHLADLGHPVAGDAKYGNPAENREFRSRFGMQNQFLHAYRIVFPEITGELEYLSHREWKAPLPGRCRDALEELWGIEKIKEIC